MKLRRLAALVSAAVLVMGMVSVVSATPKEDPTCDPAAVANICQPPPECNPEGQQNGQCPDRSEEPSHDASSEPSHDASSEPSHDASSEPSSDASEGTPAKPPADGEVAGLTSDPTLPPTDALSSTGTSGPDGTLPLVLIVLGVIGLAAVVLTPARARR